MYIYKHFYNYLILFSRDILIKKFQIKMVLQTTVVGSMPKPDYLRIPCWVDANTNKIKNEYVKHYNEVRAKFTTEELEQQIQKATREAIAVQKEAGISIGTDGEMRRDNYIYDFCRRLNGFDFVKTAEVICRNGAWRAILPQIIGPVTSREDKSHLRVADEWETVQKMSPDMPIKSTLPGPMTIYDTMKNTHYKNREDFAWAIVPFINEAVISLVERGCKHIQVSGE
jgi:Methionine synthase II (cobalamin-independent)